MSKLTVRNAIKKINERHALLVFPIQNRVIPNSLWRELLPKKKMVWDWNDEGGSETHEMWHLMKRLSDCKEVVYSKWYQGRATFFSRDFFRHVLSELRSQDGHRGHLSSSATDILSVLESDSPLSTKQLKAAVGLQGKLNEPLYQKCMKVLFQRMLIVAFGEVDDGAFPSLAVGSTQSIFEDLWLESEAITAKQRRSFFGELDSSTEPFMRQLAKVKESII